MSYDVFLKETYVQCHSIKLLFDFFLQIEFSHRFAVSEVGGEPLVSAGSAVEREVFAFVVAGGLGLDASLVLGDVTVHLDGVVGVATVGIDPVHAWWEGWKCGRWKKKN